MWSFRSTFCVIVSAVLASQVLADEDAIHVGRSSAGQIKAEIEFDQPAVLPVSVFPGINGYATGLLALHSTPLDEPANDFFQFPPASPASFQFILLAKDPGMEVWNDDGSAFMAVGQTFFIGVSPFDVHPIWNITNGTPGNSYSLTLKLHDTTGTYLDSAPIPLSFTPVPEPTGIAIACGITGLGSLRRRRGMPAARIG